MKISEKTLKVLKNFSSINNGILLSANDPLSTISESEGVYAIANIEESFPQTVAFYDLSEFLQTLQLFTAPVLVFSEDEEGDYITIEEENGNTSVEYRLTELDNITYPEEELEITSTDATFEITKDQLANLLKACNYMTLDEIKVTGDNGIIKLTAYDPKNKLGNKYSIEVGETDSEFSHILLSKNIQVILDDYTVNICNEDGVIEFKNKSIDLTYLIALEEDE